MKAQKRRHNQQQLCKVSDVVSPSPAYSSFFLSNFHHFAKISKPERLNWAETLEKLSKKEEQCTRLAEESESLRSQLTGDNPELLSAASPLASSRNSASNQETQCSAAGLERKLQVSADTVEQLSRDKTKLQDNISDMMKESGDSSVQLTKMNQDLTEKER